MSHYQANHPGLKRLSGTVEQQRAALGMVWTFSRNDTNGFNSLEFSPGIEDLNPASLSFNSQGDVDNFRPAQFTIDAENGVSLSHGNAILNLVSGASQLRGNSILLDSTSYQVNNPSTFRTALGFPDISQYARTNQANTFAGNQTFNGIVIANRIQLGSNTGNNSPWLGNLSTPDWGPLELGSANGVVVYNNLRLANCNLVSNENMIVGPTTNNSTLTLRASGTGTVAVNPAYGFTAGPIAGKSLTLEGAAASAGNGQVRATQLISENGVQWLGGGMQLSGTFIQRGGGPKMDFGSPGATAFILTTDTQNFTSPLLSIRNANAEKFSIDANGNLVFTSANPQITYPTGGALGIYGSTTIFGSTTSYGNVAGLGGFTSGGNFTFTGSNPKITFPSFGSINTTDIATIAGGANRYFLQFTTGGSGSLMLQGNGVLSVGGLMNITTTTIRSAFDSFSPSLVWGLNKISIVSAMSSEFRDLEVRAITASGTVTGAELAATPVTFAGLPPASSKTGKSIQVSDRDYAIATSNGINWLRAGTSTVLA